MGGEGSGGRGAGSWIKSNPLSFTTRRAVRAENCEFEATVTRIVAFPLPLVGLTVTHDASVRAAHSQSRAELTVTLAVPPECGIVRVPAVADTVQRAEEGPITSVSLVTPPQPGVKSSHRTEIVTPLRMLDVCSAVTNTGGNLRTVAAFAHGSPDALAREQPDQALHSPSSTSGANSLSSPTST